MIYGDVFVIGIQLELVAIYDTVKCGIFNFVIDNQLLPARGTVIELYPTIEGLKDSMNLSLEAEVPDIGAMPLEEIDFLDEPPGIISLNAAPVEDFGFCCWLGFDGNEDRFFYSTDYCKTYQEKRYPRGTIEKLIQGLPTVVNGAEDDLEFCSKNAIKIFSYLGWVADKKYQTTIPEAKGRYQGSLDEYGNEWLECPYSDNAEEPEWRILLSPKWKRKYSWPRRELDFPKTPLAITLVMPLATAERIELYHEVEIVEGKNSAEEYKNYRGRKGVVLGISEEKGIVYGYGVYFWDGKEDEFLTFEADEVTATGFCFKREEFYDGSYACVNPIHGYEISYLYVAGTQK